MNEDPYVLLARRLESVGLSPQLTRPRQMVVSSQKGPAWPNRGNSFWLTFLDKAWHLVTWLPACYRIPTNQDVVAICVACMKAGDSAMYEVPKEIVFHHGLERMSDEELAKLFPDSED